MKFKTNIKQRLHSMHRSAALIITTTIMLTSVHSKVNAQEDPVQFTTPSWWFGAAAAANGNFYQGSTHQLSADFKPPTAFHDGMGIGLFAGPSIEFYKPDSRFGAMLQVGYDNRSGVYDQVTTPCNCPADLTAKLSYLTIEPSLRFAPFKKGLFLFAGPRFAFNLQKDFTYKQGINPDYPEQIAQDDVNGEFSETNESVISMQVGLGYDIPVISQNHRTQMMISPFVAFHPYVGQDPRSIETWNITTFRGGAIVKFGFGKLTNPASAATKPEKAPKAEKAAKVEDEPIEYVVIPVPVEEKVEAEETRIIGGKASKVKFTVDSPENIPDKRVVRESFPLTNYVFFNLNSSVIPERYVQLDKAEVANFKEESVELFTPKNLSGRSDRQMIVYYNVLNVLGDRMVKNPQSNVTLSGSSYEGQADGKVLAESVKTYLVKTFGINASRITTVGMGKPTIPSEQPGGTLELVRLREEDRRVTISSNSPELLMEFQNGPDANLKPVEIKAAQTAPVESYVTFHADGASDEFEYWNLEMKDRNGMVKQYGPFETDDVTMPGKSILGDRPDGTYEATMIGKPKKNGDDVLQTSNVKMVLWTPSETEVASKYSVIYGFNTSNAIALYDKYIREVIVPAIPKNGKVIIHGHTDDIGDAGNNKKLSLARANDVQKTIKNALTAAGRTDVSMTVYGFGEDKSLALFDNKYPEGRLYNRSVIVEVVPNK